MIPPPSHVLSAESAATPWGAVRVTAISEFHLGPDSRRDLCRTIQETMRACEGWDFAAMSDAVQAALAGLAGKHFTSITIERTLERGSTP